MNITKEQVKWLDDRGGRNENDVEIDERGRKYVLMADGYGGNLATYIPEPVEKTVNKRVNKKG